MEVNKTDSNTNAVVPSPSRVGERKAVRKRRNRSSSASRRRRRLLCALKKRRTCRARRRSRSRSRRRRSRSRRRRSRSRSRRRRSRSRNRNRKRRSRSRRKNCRKKRRSRSRRRRSRSRRGSRSRRKRRSRSRKRRSKKSQSKSSMSKKASASWFLTNLWAGARPSKKCALRGRKAQKVPAWINDFKLNTYINKIRKKVVPTRTLDRNSVNIINGLMKNVLHGIASEASNKMGRRKTLNPKIIFRAMRHIMPKHIRENADEKAQRALERYMLAKKRKPLRF